MRIKTFVLWAAVILFASAARAAEFPLKEGDLVVMAGDSITAQHLHSNYIEAYCVTRFPKWNLQFRNSGVGGNKAPDLLARLDADVLCWKPTVVTIELGMNDANKNPKDITPFVKDMGTLIERIRDAGARPILLTSSPVNDGSTTDALKPHNEVLDRMASALVELGAKENVPCADQFHALLDLWAANQKSPTPVPLGGDAVHLGPVGQMTMAYACLTSLGAPALVSEAALDADAGKLKSATGCAISNLKIADSAVSFDRADDCLPMPMPKAFQPALKLVPLSEKLNRYMLAITGLKAQAYDVSIDGEKVATVGADDLAKGWNMSELTAGPVAAQCQSVLDLISKKAQIVATYRETVRWRGPDWVNDPAIRIEIDVRRKPELERLNKLVIAASEEINAAAQPKPHHFEIAPAN